MTSREPFWRRYLRFLGPNVSADIEDELVHHLAALEADLRAQGMSERAAREAARARFGDVETIRRTLRRQDTRRLGRAARADAWEGWASDLKQAVRKLWQQPGFSAAVIVVLALGIGATTAMFSAVDAALLRPLPLAQPGRLVLLRDVSIPFRPPPNSPYPPETGPRFVNLTDLAPLHDLFSHLAGYASGGLNLSDPTHPARVNVGVVTTEFFATLGVAPAQGRAFSKDEGAPGGPQVAILSYGLWRRQFGGAPMLGRSISLSGRSYSVVGIMPPGFGFPDASDVWIPLTVPVTFASFEPFRGYLPSQVIARLADGVMAPAASERLLALWTQVTGGDAAPKSLAERVSEIRQRGAAEPFQRDLVGRRRAALLVLLGATGLLLLVACANVTNLLLSRAAGRRREIALRATLGAARARIVRQLLVESVVLAAAGAVLGLALAPLGLRLVATLMPASFEGLAAPQLDLRVLLFAATLAFVAGLGFGLWPAIGSSRTDVAEAIKSGGDRGASARGRGRARRGLLVAELALTLLLLVGAGLMLKTLERLLGTGLGFDPEHVATLEWSFGSGSRAAHRQVIDAVLGRLAHVPGVEAAGIVNDLPFRGGGGIAVRIRPQGAAPASDTEHGYGARYLQATGGYFRALGIPLLRGRVFTPAEDSVAPPVAIISDALARAAWPNQDPIGRRFTFVGPTSYTVVGVVGDVRESLGQDPSDLGPWAGMQMYFSAHAIVPANVALVVRGSLPDAALLHLLRDVVRQADPMQAVYNVRMMDEAVSTSLAPRRTNTLLITGFGTLALILAALGVYAVVAYGVAQRVREFGIRVALGATGGDLLNLVGREMIWVALAGLAVGLGGAWAAARVLASQLYGVTAHDTATFVLAPVVLLAAVLAATLLPAWRARRVHPMDVIRTE